MHGIHIRQYARTFIIAEPQPGGKRICFVSIDACMGSQLLRVRVIEKLRARFGELYTDNVAISGTHTHSGPAGYFEYVLFQVTSLGFVKETLDALVEGIFNSILMAHNNLVPGNITVTAGELLDANINRSPSAYLNNPAVERAKYQYDVDKTMVQLKMVDAHGRGIGLLNWFAVHCTSMNNTNTFISGDNKGRASQLVERAMNAGRQGRRFVAAFAQTNEGDVSPNTRGAKCFGTGAPCDFNTSTCGGRNEHCWALGPGRDCFESTDIIGRRQADISRRLYDEPGVPLSGPVDFRHTFVDMSNVTVSVNGTLVRLCKSAMGYSFAAGTTDGPGAFDFRQGDTSPNPFWNFIVNALEKPSPEQAKCHLPKPILLNTGEVTFPYGLPWQPQIVDVQLLRVGQLVIAAVPGEFSTMAGRRLRDQLKATLVQLGIIDAQGYVVIAGLANTYTDYVTTFEEYQVQRYEGASTIFGPHTLAGYIEQFRLLAQHMARGEPAPPGPQPPDIEDKLLSFLPPVIEDSVPAGRHFGDVEREPLEAYRRGDAVVAVFWSASPRNNRRPEGTFLTVEQLDAAAGTWTVRYTDADWETKFHWQRTSFLSSDSHATITWQTSAVDEPGTYRIRHFGEAKHLFGRRTAFEGTTRTFHLTA